MPTIEASTWLALRTRIEALVTTPALPVLWPGESTELPAAPCIEVTFLPNTVNRLFLKGSSPHQRPGILQISLLTIPGAPQHEAQAQQLAGTIAVWFPADLILFYGGIKVRITAGPTVSGGYRDDSRSRWVTPVTIKFEVLA
jgi:hypothetical protein